jgi:hypothetical protein
MADQYRDSCVDRQNKTRKVFKGKPNDPIRVSFYDKDGMRVNDVTRSEANCVETNFFIFKMVMDIRENC